MGRVPTSVFNVDESRKTKNMTKDEIRHELVKECADVFAYLLVFAENEGVDLSQELLNKWGKYTDTINL
jgi:phosphoribosyl-ATP pyrophosphohydrolase